MGGRATCDQSNMQADVKWLAGLWFSHLEIREGIHNVKDTCCWAVLTNQLQIRAESLCCGIANGSVLGARACQLQCKSLQDSEATLSVRTQARQTRRIQAQHFYCLGLPKDAMMG